MYPYLLDLRPIIDYFFRESSASPSEGILPRRDKTTTIERNKEDVTLYKLKFSFTNSLIRPGPREKWLTQQQLVEELILKIRHFLTIYYPAYKYSYGDLWEHPITHKVSAIALNLIDTYPLTFPIEEDQQEHWFEAKLVSVKDPSPAQSISAYERQMTSFYRPELRISNLTYNFLSMHARKLNFLRRREIAAINS